MSFSTLRRLRYVDLILTKADMAASQRHVVGNGITLPELYLPIQDILAPYYTKMLSVRRS